jgi:heptosyltransferase II
LLTNSLWTALVGRLARVPRIVGYPRDSRRWLLHEPITSNVVDDQHLCTIDEYLNIAEHLGCETRDRRMELQVTSEESLWASQLWQCCGLRSDLPTVVINSGSATDVSRLWPVEHVYELAHKLSKEHGLQVLLHCGPSERMMADRIAEQVNDPRVVSMGKACTMTDSKASTLPIGLSKGVLSRATAVVSTDSGPRHIAVALNRPVVSLFGPTDPLRTRTFNLAELPITTELECGKCYASSCPFKHGNCMRGLLVQQVYSSIIEILRQVDRTAA